MDGRRRGGIGSSPPSSRAAALGRDAQSFGSLSPSAQLFDSVAAEAGCLIAAAVAAAGAAATAVATAAGTATAVATAAGTATAVSSAAGAAATAAAAAAGRGATAASGSASLEVLAAGLRESGVALGLLDRLAHISLPGLTGDRGTVDVTTDRTGTVVAPVPGARWITGPHGRGQGLREAEQPGVADVEVRRTGLRARRDSDAQTGGRTAFECLRQRIGDALGDVLVEDAFAALARQVELLAVAVLDLGDRLGPAELAFVREGREGRCHGDGCSLRRSQDRRGGQRLDEPVLILVVQLLTAAVADAQVHRGVHDVAHVHSVAHGSVTGVHRVLRRLERGHRALALTVAGVVRIPVSGHARATVVGP